MGFWERDVRDSIDDMFDLNRDGKIDPFEEGLLIEFMSDDEERSHGLYDDDDDYDIDGDDDF